MNIHGSIHRISFPSFKQVFSNWVINDVLRSSRRMPQSINFILMSSNDNWNGHVLTQCSYVTSSKEGRNRMEFGWCLSGSSGPPDWLFNFLFLYFVTFFRRLSEFFQKTSIKSSNDCRRCWRLSKHLFDSIKFLIIKFMWRDLPDIYTESISLLNLYSALLPRLRCCMALSNHERRSHRLKQEDKETILNWWAMAIKRF